MRVREQCKSCKRYTFKATCPPHCESVEYYKNLLPTYRYGELYLKKYIIEDMSKWKELGKLSTEEISNCVLAKRAQMMNIGFHFAVGFTAGSCKNCDTCSFPCRYPEKSLVPLEATGINVVKLVKEVTSIKIGFPVHTEFYRIGMLLWSYN